MSCLQLHAMPAGASAETGLPAHGTRTVAPRSGGQLTHAGEPRAMPSEKINPNQKCEVQLRGHTGHTAHQWPPRRAARSSHVHQGRRCPYAGQGFSAGAPLPPGSQGVLVKRCHSAGWSLTLLRPGPHRTLTAGAAHRSRPSPADELGQCTEDASRSTLGSRPRRPPARLLPVRRLASRRKRGRLPLSPAPPPSGDLLTK